MIWVVLILLILVAYVYVGYPVLAGLLAAIMRRHPRKGDVTPTVSVIIAAYNEADHIGATIENKLEQDYPDDRLDIIVVSDGSDDGTDEIVKSYADRGVRLIRQEPRQGKTAGLNLAVKEATGEIIVFSDANSIYAKDAISKLARNFADPSVGYVTGKMVYVTRSGSSVSEGCSAYMKYENMLREFETRLGSVVGVDGGIDAVRRDLYRDMDPALLPDFVLPLNVVEQGYRVVYEPLARLREEALHEARSEYRMRVRVSLRAFHALWYKRNLFNPLRYGLFSWQLFSHKLLRYFVGILLILIFAGSFAVARPLAWWLIAVQTVGYLAAFAGYLLQKTGRSVRILYFPFYFVLLNLAATVAFVKFLRGEQQVTWTPRKGTGT